MAKLFILGSANAIPGPERENTYFFLENGSHSILVDCASGAFVKLQQCRVPLDGISDIVITHFHPDHVAGLALLLMDWWLLGRKAPLVIYGLEYTLERVKKMMDLFTWSNWPDFFPVSFHNIPETYSTVLQDEQVSIQSILVNHLIPTVGLRFELKQAGLSIAYSCDTSPCEGVITLGKDADILIHECAGSAKGHSTATQCGQAAAKANAHQLYLIHYPDDADLNELIRQAKAEFTGEVVIATDMMVLE
jgi:ribonuclease Z